MNALHLMECWCNVRFPHDVGVLVLGWSYACLSSQLPTGVNHGSALGSSYSVRYGMKCFNHQIPESESGNTVHAQTCIERNNSSFWFLALQLIAKQTCWLPKMHRESSDDVDFRVFKIYLRSQSLETILVCIDVHVFPTMTTLLCIHKCMMNVRDQTRLSVCHKILSIIVVTARASLFTDHKNIKVSKYEPNTKKSEQFVSKL